MKAKTVLVGLAAGAIVAAIVYAVRYASASKAAKASRANNGNIGSKSHKGGFPSLSKVVQDIGAAKQGYDQLFGGGAPSVDYSDQGLLPSGAGAY